MLLWDMKIARLGQIPEFTISFWGILDFVGQLCYIFGRQKLKVLIVHAKSPGVAAPGDFLSVLG